MPAPAAVALTDAQLDAVLHAAAPIAVRDRAAFLQALAAALAGQREIGDGALHRVLVSLQHTYLRPPRHGAHDRRVRR